MSRTTTTTGGTMVPTPEVWAQEQFGGADLGDLRLSKRAVKVAAGMAADPSGSIPRQGGGQWKRTKGAYRLFDHDRVRFESLSASPWELTRRRAGECKTTTGECRTVLLIQDTTWLDYADHRATAGLGWAGRNARKGKPRGGSGLFLHGVLAVEPVSDDDDDDDDDEGARVRGRVLGLAWGKLWARDGEGPRNADQKSRSKRRCADDRESLRWQEAIEAVGPPPAEANANANATVRWVHVGDREADIFSLYATAKQTGVGFVVRVMQDRSALAGHDEHAAPPTLSREARKDCGLKALCRDERRLPVLGRTRVWIAPRGGRRGRWAQVTVAAGPVTLYSPQLDRTGHALRVWAVRVFEPDPPKGQKALEWMLLTDRPVESAADALEVAGWYALRWLIEEFFHCLKTGCRVEDRQLESADRLAPLIGMLCVVAARLLALKCDARLTPDRPASECLEPDVVQTLCRLVDADLDPRTLTVGRFFVEVARLGGHLARKRDGPPGWKTLWHGWQKLTMIHEGYRLAKEAERCG